MSGKVWYAKPGKVWYAKRKCKGCGKVHNHKITGKEEKGTIYYCSASCFFIH